MRTKEKSERWCFRVGLQFTEHAHYLFLCSYAESVGAKHYHTSAKLNKGIEELFLDLCKSKT